MIEVTLPWVHISAGGFVPNVRMFSLCLRGFVSGYSVFLPQAKNMHAKTGDSKLPLGVSVGVNGNLVLLCVDPVMERWRVQGEP